MKPTFLSLSRSLLGPDAEGPVVDRLADAMETAYVDALIFMARRSGSGKLEVAGLPLDEAIARVHASRAPLP